MFSLPRQFNTYASAIIFGTVLSIAGCGKAEQQADSQQVTANQTDVEQAMSEQTMSDQVTAVKEAITNDLNAGFSTRLKTPRIQPVDRSTADLSDEQKAMLDSRADYNLYKTLVQHIELYNRWTPLGRQLLNGSTLPARDREIIMLRMGWLCQAEYEWAQHARIATAESIGMTEKEIHNIAFGADPELWSSWENTLITMVDELRYDTKISDATWTQLRTKYSEQETMDALFTAAQYQLVSMVLNGIGIQLDPILKHRLPTDLPKPAAASLPSSPRLSKPRLAPLTESEWTEEQKNIIQPHIRDDGSVYNLYSTMLHHPSLFGPRYTFGSYLLRDSGLPAKTREILIMRTGWLIRAEYEWAHHDPIAKTAGLSEVEIYNIAVGADAPEWSEEHSAVIRAADELRREAFITDGTWNTLEKYYDTKQLVEILFTVGGYTMTGLAINSFGIQVEEGFPGFPEIPNG